MVSMTSCFSGWGLRQKAPLVSILGIVALQVHIFLLLLWALLAVFCKVSQKDLVGDARDDHWRSGHVRLLRASQGHESWGSSVLPSLSGPDRKPQSRQDTL
jgi:hypothetical protein